REGRGGHDTPVRHTGRRPTDRTHRRITGWGAGGAPLSSWSMEVTQSAKLANVCYDIRGPVLQEGKRMEHEGHHVLKLNIGNPAPFGFEAPEEMLQDVILNLPTAHGYGDSKGL